MKNLIPTLLAWGPLGVFVMALLDAAGVPNPAGVDYLLLLISWKNPQVAYWSALVAVLGSILGSYFLYWIARRGGEAFLDKHTRSGRGKKFHAWFKHYGLVTVFIPALVPMIPLPMKVFVVCCGVFGVNVLAFLGVLILARVPRFFALAYLGRSLGEDAMGWLRSHAKEFGLAALALFVLMFLLVRTVDRYRQRSARLTL